MNAKDAWLATLGQLKVQLPRTTYDTWLRRAELVGHEDGRYVVSVPNDFVRDWLNRHLIGSMEASLASFSGRPATIEITVWEPDPSDSPLFRNRPAPRALLYGTLNPFYTLETYLEGETNRYAALLAHAIVDGPIGRYSPAFFAGPLGVGKTHLLQGIAAALADQGYGVIYATAEDFTTELVSAIRAGGRDFRDKYRTADAVLIDDLQFIDGKEATQAELVAIWDALRNRGRSMIFAADRLPRDMARLSGDAKSRLQGGPIAVIDAPDYDLRCAILAAKSKARGLPMLPVVVQHIAERLTTHVRDLEGVVEQVETYATLTRQPVTLEIAEMALRAVGASVARHGAPTLEDVLTAVSRYYGLTIEDLTGRKRTKAIVHARQMAMYLAREDAAEPLTRIGLALGKRDHSTIAHGCARAADLIATDPDVSIQLSAIRASLRGAEPPTAPARVPVPAYKNGITTR
jgi:chromosomal replication initiator protein